MTTVIFVAISILVIGYVASGRLPFRLAPSVEGRSVTATYSLAVSAPFDATMDYADTLIEAADRAIVATDSQDALSPPSKISAPMEMKKEASISSSCRPKNVTSRWRSSSPPGGAKFPPSPISKTSPFCFGLAPAPAPPLKRCSPIPILKYYGEASSRAAARIAEFPGATDIDDGFSLGKPQYSYALTPEGKALGLSESDLGRALRSRFEGSRSASAITRTG